MEPQRLVLFALVILFSHSETVAASKCRKRASASRTLEFNSNDRGPDVGAASNIRLPTQDVYFWPSLTKHEKSVIRDAFFQISLRTCLRFNELPYKPWYHADRWEVGKPYVIIRKSKSFTGYSDNEIEEVNRRSIVYLTEKSLNHPVFNTSRGIVMSQLVGFMGMKGELLRPDAASYIQPLDLDAPVPETPQFTSSQLMWPFDPESVTIPHTARNHHTLTIYCLARSDKHIGAGQRVGLLTRWDAVKLNSMYCPHEIGYADPRMGPCVVERKHVKKHRLVPTDFRA